MTDQRPTVRTMVVTGSSGLLGWHLRCRARTHDCWRVREVYRDDFEDPSRLARALSEADAVVHLAGMNRGDPDLVKDTNIRLAEKLVSALCESGGRPHLIFSSSTHIDRDTPYGASKREASRIFDGWAAKQRAPFSSLILPNVFGEAGRPFYNSVVSTFCHQLANGGTPKIIEDIETQQIHAGSVADLVFGLAEQGAGSGEHRVSGCPITVSDLLEMLKRFDSWYRSDIIPPLESALERALFNTYRSYLFPAHYPVTLLRRVDARGTLVESVKAKSGGQTFFSTTQPGVVRGNHFHLRKVERFLVLAGEAEIAIRRLFSDHVEIFRVSGDTPAYVDIPTLHTHNIRNTGDTELLTLFWSNELFDPADSDTFAEDV